MSDHDQWHDDPDGTEAGTDVNRTKVKKAPTAFRTISEVADDLHIPQHVLRFWEQRFPQVKPLKRGGGRRYYRPEDVELLRRISSLLYIKGYTIKGVQRLLREGGSLEGIEPRTGVEGEADVGPDDETDELPFEPQPAPRAHQALRRPASRPVALSAPQPPEPSMVVRSVLQPVPNAASGSLDIVGLQALLEELIALRDVLPR